MRRYAKVQVSLEMIERGGPRALAYIEDQVLNELAKALDVTLQGLEEAGVKPKWWMELHPGPHPGNDLRDWAIGEPVPRAARHAVCYAESAPVYVVPPVEDDLTEGFG